MNINKPIRNVNKGNREDVKLRLAELHSPSEMMMLMWNMRIISQRCCILRSVHLSAADREEEEEDDDEEEEEEEEVEEEFQPAAAAHPNRTDQAAL